MPYPPGDLAGPPPRNLDPGRARPAAVFDKMYGGCRRRRGQAPGDVAWLPTEGRPAATRDADQRRGRRLAGISRELDALPAPFDRYLVPPPAPTSRHRRYHTRVRARARHRHRYRHRMRAYWRWSRPRADGSYAYRNAIPMEIVASSSGTASSGAASGTTTTRCISSTGRSCWAAVDKGARTARPVMRNGPGVVTGSVRGARRRPRWRDARPAAATGSPAAPLAAAGVGTGTASGSGSAFSAAAGPAASLASGQRPLPRAAKPRELRLRTRDAGSLGAWLRAGLGLGHR